MHVLNALLLLAAAAAPALVAAVPAPGSHADHDHATPTVGGLPAPQWYHEASHPVHNLFRRHDKRQAAPIPSVGSPAWTALYPASTPDSSKLPKAWVDALNAAVAAGKIPTVPQTTESGGNSPAYPAGTNRNDPSVCAATDRVCRIPGDIWDAPTGMMGIGFDDGPTQASPPLYTFLQQNNQRATHFMIGVNILNNWQMFNTAYGTLNDDIAVHTWTHPYMTTLSNLDVLAQLGWTMQIIHDSTGGKLPRFWRPPYGDIDTRVSAIAREVLGMTAIIWNQDTEDWSVASHGTTMQQIATNMQRWLSGPKTPGLIILEHELDNNTVTAFIQNYPLIKQNNWNAVSTAELNATLTAWQQADDIDDTAFASVTVTESGGTSSTATPSANSTSGSSSTGTSVGASQSTQKSSALSHPSTSALALFLACVMAFAPSL